MENVTKATPVPRYLVIRKMVDELLKKVNIAGYSIGVKHGMVYLFGGIHPDGSHNEHVYVTEIGLHEFYPYESDDIVPGFEQIEGVSLNGNNTNNTCVCINKEFHVGGISTNVENGFAMLTNNNPDKNDGRNIKDKLRGVNEIFMLSNDDLEIDTIPLNIEHVYTRGIKGKYTFSSDNSPIMLSKSNPRETFKLGYFKRIPWSSRTPRYFEFCLNDNYTTTFKLYNAIDEEPVKFENNIIDENEFSLIHEMELTGTSNSFNVYAAYDGDLTIIHSDDVDNQVWIIKRTALGKWIHEHKVLESTDPAFMIKFLRHTLINYQNNVIY